MAKTTARTGPTVKAPTRRLGPRPLPLHLAVAASTWLSSSAALPVLKNGWPLWKPALRAAGAELQRSLQSVDNGAFQRAVARELTRRTDDFRAGVQAYRRHPYRRPAIDPPVVWRDGTTRLLDYGVGQAGAPILIVPSLINRFYILDLSERLSLARYLADRGLRPFVVDWDRPGPVERTFTLTDYIAGRLDQALDHVAALGARRRPLLLGYCMGGLLALALAERRRRDIAGLALLATPWDFHADQAG
ncbi:MAG: alpha/beta hydrolase, partial [Alphaproteobacteria bacterium]|nr:alpha/beta hydrolase [Alphaproteobacteria bacterium]